MEHTLDQAIAAIKADLIATRKELHRIPEGGFKEFRTAALVAEYLQNLGLPVQTGVGGTGVVALLEGALPGPTIGLRACLDALEMEEHSAVDYASQHEGFFHGCGHDGNMTMVLGAARILVMQRENLRGSVKFIFQPSEEETGGAAAMIEAGVLEQPALDAIFHIHNWHGLPEHVLAVAEGPVLASSDVFHLEVIGRPGHGAWPHLTVDPVGVAAEVIGAVQRIVSREVDPMKPALITIGKIQGGTAVNLIPEKVSLDGTVRTYSPEVRAFIAHRLEEVVRGITQSARATYRLTYDRIMPPAWNDPALTHKIRRILEAGAPPLSVSPAVPLAMGCEEFALFQERIPGVFLFLGKDEPGQPVVPIHDPRYVFNDEILTTGVSALCRIVLDF